MENARWGADLPFGGILGQNGKVITAGTEMGGSWCDPERCDGSTRCPDNDPGPDCGPPKVTNRYPTLYEPWYITQERPTILGLPNEQFVEVQNGQTFTLRFQLPLGRALKSVVLMRPGSVTHSMNFDQRMVRCYFDPIPACTDDLTVCQTTVTSPWSCYTAPPGYYLLFVVDSTDVPSEAAWVRLTCPPQVGMMMAQFGDLSQEAETAPASPFENYPLTVEFRDPVTGAVTAVYTMPMDAPVQQGSVAARFSTDLPAGRYELYVRPYRSWLGRKLPVQWAPESRIMVPLINGDVNGDNRINELDLERLTADLSRTGVDLPSDVNRDGMVDGEDLNIVVNHLGSRGD